VAATADLRKDLRAGSELFGMTVFSRHSIHRRAVKMRSIHEKEPNLETEPRLLFRVEY
jgi:hypothetical protein